MGIELETLRGQSQGPFTGKKAVDGLYYFSFSTYGYNTHVTGAMLMKNAVRQILAYHYPSAFSSAAGCS
ncbi:putative complement C1q-like protein 2 [Scophthalmus maximus]|uniref:Putative complement C1q-like protein 2 n=1 Tax=Scophthalmus maximus TaxID=52904 RepID=A0A2U9AZZ1_SCOMX|nr:putative complement C1q-like protein 2 [Scophthalmus maximus]